MKDINLNEAFIKDMKRRFVKSFLDMLVLKLVQSEPMWGYKILKKTENLYQIKLRHGALYPLLNALEQNGFLTSEKQYQKGRMRKVYTITPKGKQLIEEYNTILKEQIQKGEKNETKESGKSS